MKQYELIVLICRWVKTGNGQTFADAIGVKEPPLTLDESVRGVLAQVCLSPLLNLLEDSNHIFAN